MSESSIDGSITRAEVIQRAKFWVDKEVEYGTVFNDDGDVVRTKSAADPAGKRYRTDCSGLVSMCWHLNQSLTTLNFNPTTGGRHWRDKFKLPSFDDLRPGDALVKRGHIEMFASWVNPSNHSKGAFVYSFNNLNRTVQNPDHPTNQDRLGRNSNDEMAGYTPIRYKKILENAPTPPPIPTKDGAFLREPDGTICLLVGGMPFHVSPAEYDAMGRPPFTEVPDDTFEKLSGLIRNGTFIRVGEAISIVAGSAKHHLSLEEWQAMGRPAFVNVPARLADALDSSPTDNTFLRNHLDGAISQVIGDAAMHLKPVEYADLGRPPAVDVPPSFPASITLTVPVGTLFLRNPTDGAIFLAVGGARHHLTPDEYAQLGKPSFTNTSIRFIERLGSVPEDDTYLRDPSDGAIFAIKGGTKRHLSPEEWDALGEQSYTNVPQSLLDRIPTA